MMEQNERIRTFFRGVSDYCKSISNNMPVSISPFFSGGGSALDEDVVASIYTDFLKGDEQVKGAGVDLAMLQDGVGARCQNSEAEIFLFVQPYFRAFLRATQEASKVNKITLWGNVETYKTVQGGCIDNYLKPLILKPAEFSRVQLQLQAASFDYDNNEPFFEKLVTFDFFHYMSPVHPGSTLAARQRLYSAYIASYVNGIKKEQRKQKK